MARHILAVLAVTLLVVTSGCLGILGFGGSSTPTPTPAAKQSTPPPTPAPEKTNLTGLKTDHREALMNSSGWTVKSTMTFSMDANTSMFSELSLQERAKIDLENHRYWQRKTGFLGPTIKYTNQTHTFKKQSISNSSSYSYKRKPYENDTTLLSLQPVNTTKATGIEYLIVNESVTYTKQGTASVNGANTTVYAIENASDLMQQWLEMNGGGNTTLTGTSANTSIKDFSSKMYVEQDRRIVRRAKWSITVLNERKGEAVSINVSLDISKVGSTNVTPPDWLPTALEESEDQSVSLVGGNGNETSCSFYTTDVETEKIRLNNGSYRVRVHIEEWGDAEAIHLEMDGERQSTIRKKWTDADVPNTGMVVPDDSLVQVTATSQSCPEGRLLEFISVG